MQRNIIKIDLCNSKLYAATREKVEPNVRANALTKLIEAAKPCFPDGDKEYPDGSFYRAEGDAVYFIVEKPSVAVRCAIELMQRWYHEALPDFPECRVLIDNGTIQHVPAPGKTELVGKPFENMSIFEKAMGEGQIYATDSVIQDMDRTMATFGIYGRYRVSQQDELSVYSVNFLDPRTTADSSLIHAIFVAHPKATEARERVIELFLIEHALEMGGVVNLTQFPKWCRDRDYPSISEHTLRQVLEHSGMFAVTEDGNGFLLTEQHRRLITKAQAEFAQSRQECVEQVAAAIHEHTGSDKATASVDLSRLTEEYLSAVFSEIRVMANYFRETHQLFQCDRMAFAKFDYILRRCLPLLGPNQFAEWKTGFLAGLQRSAQSNSQYIAAIFHNVLATYYINRSPTASPYQLARLKERRIYLDTNVLYAQLVTASNYHELVSYIVDHLSTIGVRPRVYPFTVEEYEQSLESVERNYHDGKPSVYLLEKNPWILQEFLGNRGKYLDSMGVCRQQHSISKGIPIAEENYDQLRSKLQQFGLDLETDFAEYSDDDAQELWARLRGSVADPQWDMEQYWEFIVADANKPDAIIHHDVRCLQNLAERSEGELPDELGIRTLFLTLDGKLFRLRREYPFVISPEQCLEFFLPYLFIADIPLKEAESFPNRLISAGLASLLVSRPPELVEVVDAFLRNPGALDSSEHTSETARNAATALNSARFRQVVENTKTVPDSAKPAIASEIADLLEQARERESKKYYDEFAEMQSALRQQAKQIDKLQKAVNYWRAEARRKQ